MINSANTVDLQLNTNDVLLPPAVVPLDKFKLANASKIPQGGGERYAETLTQLGCRAHDNANAYSQTAETKEVASLMSALDPKKRVHVQHLQTHPNLQNNRFKCDTFHSLDAVAAAVNKKKADAYSNNNNNCNSNNNNNNNFIWKESAFNQSYKADRIASPPNKTSAMGVASCGGEDALPTSRPPPMGDSRIPSDRPTTIFRTEYQENAYLRIEEVHNYAKLERYSYSNESSNSSIHDEENDDEDEELDEDITRNYERYLNRGKQLDSSSYKANAAAHAVKGHRVAVEQREKADAVQPQLEAEAVVAGTPDHHARRPMNAFLIFCKRHRAIVKERYKSLENRAITKILGDWWASLDVNDKKCFTNLAQQNKDAFFSANPNFKWYKLPAPPLRTLHTRPGNAERTLEQELEDVGVTTTITSSVYKSAHGNGNGSNYFKLADEAEMGELSTLISGENNNNNNHNNNNNINNSNHSALQQALGETTQFLSAHMPHSNDLNNASPYVGKRRLHSENSFSSNSSEEEAVPKKSSRTCKGKIYQELINSGQIAAVAKKLKTPKSQLCSNVYLRLDSQPHIVPASATDTDTNTNTNVSPCDAALPAKDSARKCAVTAFAADSGTQPHCELAHFDLEEKIKELPALSLDLYLQRKRNTKKKKKFSSKKRNSNSASSNKSSSSANAPQTPPATPPKSVREPPPQQAVGSQKRKARKESITRRDVSAIANEIASVIPLPASFSTINGCYIFNESPDPTEVSALAVNAAAVASIGTPTTRAHCAFGSFTDNISSTSDLLILAEVAANRTELTN